MITTERLEELEQYSRGRGLRSHEASELIAAVRELQSENESLRAWKRGYDLVLKELDGYEPDLSPYIKVRQLRLVDSVARQLHAAQQSSGDALVSRSAVLEICNRFAQQNDKGATKAIRRDDLATYDVLDSCKHEAEAIAAEVAALPAKEVDGK
ncbi:MAG TPA: hypothetical protein VJS64_09420 [Pyrinomonadaceae bacterium]|nr:hypothetical protein [Pyrinomonadaceae bacterium]